MDFFDRIIGAECMSTDRRYGFGQGEFRFRISIRTADQFFAVGRVKDAVDRAEIFISVSNEDFL